MNIQGKITGLKYATYLQESLKSFDIKEFDINETPSSFILNYNGHSFAVSKWVSPKRTRSYPFERVYNTLCSHASKKITVIPIVKDEGIKGDRDFIQWDTISLMSLFDVYVIFSYYEQAEINQRNQHKITNQKFNNSHVISKIKEIKQYHSSALHWNLNELNTNLYKVINQAKNSYAIIEKTTKVLLHNPNGIDNLMDKIQKDIDEFMKFSREKAEKAQKREFVTIQPKESLSTLSKAKITIFNYLGGKYFFTVDETKLIDKNLFLIEGKQSNNSVLPGKSDIKDGLLKMILYSNLAGVTVNNQEIKTIATLKLTSSNLKGNITSEDTLKERNNFFKKKSFFGSQKKYHL